MSAGTPPCFHCGEPCPPGEPITVHRQGEDLPVCCNGCKAVSELIFNSGLDRYYRFREGEARRADEDLDELLAAWRSCDERRDLWGVPEGEGRYDLLLQTEGVRCAACAWLIRSRLEPAVGIERVQVDIGTGYTRILWDPSRIALSTLAAELASLGYRPHLPLAEDEERGRLRERRNAMLRLGVAGLGMMQVMMYAVGLYAGEAMGISAGAERFLEWTSLLVTIPVVLYAGRPFFEGAVAGLRSRRMGMDVPVALAIGVAFVASCVNFLRGAGEVYFDSVVMFVFFLSAARYVQLVQRHRNLQSGAALARLLPEWAQRIRDGEVETVLLRDLAAGDRVRVRPGEPFPADGVIESGSTRVDESLLTGESRWLQRGPGEPVVGGSINQSQSVDVRVTATGQGSTVSALGRLLLQARSRSGHAATLAERTSGWFVGAVLLIAAVTGFAWASQDPSRVLPTVLAVLVVSCPCALSLAFPAALAAAGRNLLQQGTLLTRSDALEALARADIAVFDKTGTLTEGRPSLAGVVINRDHPQAGTLDEDSVLGIAAALESHSAHPLATAFRRGGTGLTAQDVSDRRHRGLEGMVEGRTWRIGSAAHVGFEPGSESDDGSVWLADDDGWLARFAVQDRLREGGSQLVKQLASRGVQVCIASGDAAPAVERVARELGIEDWRAGLTPEDKMALVETLQAEGRTVLMVGDGVNDGPVLATADVSMTVKGATELANSAADLILTEPSLAGVWKARDLAREARRTVRQNMAWAIGYNTLALPLAVAGLLQPWMAALGMSASSLLVVANSARLTAWGRPRSSGGSDAVRTMPAEARA
ncbi:MAG: heavy metal translocating P-type ATPase [Xanthomonadales bacterium]|jgi:Cu2+-exporting ATPase|nr:heavy metal translocating P-type ATPase [Xanthomonadales bacterium]